LPQSRIFNPEPRPDYPCRRRRAGQIASPGTGRVAALTAAVDIDAPPPDGEPVALVLFGTNQAAPVQIAAARHHTGAAPLVIATGGINRHNRIIEGREFARQLS
jgi:hypothetical protein